MQKYKENQANFEVYISDLKEKIQKDFDEVCIKCAIMAEFCDFEKI